MEFVILVWAVCYTPTGSKAGATQDNDVRGMDRDEHIGGIAMDQKDRIAEALWSLGDRMQADAMRAAAARATSLSIQLYADGCMLHSESYKWKYGEVA